MKQIIAAAMLFIASPAFAEPLNVGVWDAENFPYYVKFDGMDFVFIDGKTMDYAKHCKITHWPLRIPHAIGECDDGSKMILTIGEGTLSIDGLEMNHALAGLED